MRPRVSLVFYASLFFSLHKSVRVSAVCIIFRKREKSTSSRCNILLLFVWLWVVVVVVVDSIIFIVVIRVFFCSHSQSKYRSSFSLCSFLFSRKLGSGTHAPAYASPLHCVCQCKTTQFFNLQSCCFWCY